MKSTKNDAKTIANNLSIYQYLELQPLESDDNNTSELDEYLHDEVIDLDEQIDENVFEEKWDEMIESIHNDPDKLTFSEE